jgi:hypothetical protein
MQTYSFHENFFKIKLYSISFFKPCNGVEVIVLTFERYIRAEVVTYRLGVAFGSLHTQQLHGFDEFRNDQGNIQNCSDKINTAVHHFIFPHHLSFIEFFD